MIRGDNHLVLDNMRDDFPDLVQWVHTHGRPAKPGGLLTYELRSVNLTLLDPLDALPYGTGHKTNLALAAAEALQMISGMRDTALLRRIDSTSLDFSVGERISGQLDSVARTLQMDGQSRQAVATSWDPMYDNGVTLSFQFLWREDKLELHVNSRSTNVMVAPELNFFPATQLQISMARFLNTSVGSYEHHAGSFHLNSTDLMEGTDMLHKTDVLTRPSDIPLGFGDGTEQLWKEVADRAKFVLDVGAGRITEGVNVNAFSDTEKWYLDKLRPFWTPGG